MSPGYWLTLYCIYALVQGIILLRAGDERDLKLLAFTFTFAPIVTCGLIISAVIEALKWSLTVGKGDLK